MTTTTTLRHGRAAWIAALVALACILGAACGASSAHAAYGDGYDLADGAGAIPGPKAFWAGTCDLADAPAPGQPIPGGYGAMPTQVLVNPGFPPFVPPTYGPAPATPRDCIDPGITNADPTSAAVWNPIPAGRQAAVTQAGAHPDASTTFAFTRDVTNQSGLANLGPMPAASTRDVLVDLPPGLVGNPQAVPQCTNAAFEANPSQCPAASQVGVAALSLMVTVLNKIQVYPVYNLEPLPGRTAEFGIPNVGGLTSIRITANARTDGDFGLTTGVERIPTGMPLLQQTLTFWGVPWAASHDPFRIKGGSSLLHGYPNNAMGAILPGGLDPADQAHYDPSWGPIKPFFTNPTACDGSMPTTRLTVDSWQHPGATLVGGSPDLSDPNWVTGAWASPAVTGCGALRFDGHVAVQSRSRAAGAPAGLDVDLSVPQNNDAPANVATDATAAAQYWRSQAGFATSHLKDTTVVLPQGMTVNAAAATGLAACSEAQIGLTREQPVRFDNHAPACPDASRLGTVQIDTPLLSDPLTGSVYLAAPHANPFHSLLALYLVAASPARGLTIKLAGRVDADPATGRLTATFADNPQLPFSDLHLRLKGGSRAPLANPAACGTVVTHSVLTPWAAPDVPAAVTDDPMHIDQGCEQSGKFAPSLTAGVVNPQAGASSPFVMRFSRPDGQQELGAINGSLPPGLLGVLKSVPLCSAAQGAAGTCPAASRVGKVEVAAGVGSTPVHLPEAGRGEDSVYLTEPYRKGDIAGLSVVVPAVAGPFDLGTVVTKVYLKLRDEDQGIDLQSEKLPRILEGIPLNIREVVVTIDRKAFMVNPTSCAEMASYANVFSQSWAKVPVTSRFQVGGCASLPVSPVIAARAGGKGNVKRYTHPALRVSIRQSADQAHLSKTNVVLPRALNVDLKAPALKASCPRDVYAKDECSPVATIGTVRAVTPLLREPLTGPAFLIQKKGQLPDIVMRLRNNRMSLDLIGVLDFLKDGRLITRVKGIPDAALSSFVLTIKGGKGGSLLNRSSLCSRKRLVKATFQGQNGKLSYKTPVMHVAGCGKARAAARAAAKAGARRRSRVAVRRAGARVSAAGDQRAAGDRP